MKNEKNTPKNLVELLIDGIIGQSRSVKDLTQVNQAYNFALDDAFQAIHAMSGVILENATKINLLEQQNKLLTQELKEVSAFLDKFIKTKSSDMSMPKIKDEILSDDDKFKLN